MTDNNPVPNPVPAATPPIMGPAISYAAVRGVINSGQSLEKALESKIRNSISSTINTAAGIGAGLESRVLNRINDKLEPVKSTLDNTEDLIRNSIAGQMAPAAAYLEDTASLVGSATQPGNRIGPEEPTGTGGSRASSPYPYAAAAGVPPPGIIGTGVTRQQSLRRSGLPPPPPAGGPCANPPDAAIRAVTNALIAYEAAHQNPPLPIAYDYWLDPNCCVFTQGEGNQDPELQRCSTHFGVFTMTASDAPNVLALIVNTLRQNGVPAATGNCTASCSTSGGVDCKVNPLDPTCPPDCKTHPEDPRCPPPTCPTQPCVIDVTCPPPQINIPPCPTPYLPQCIQIDLCDWDKFCKFLTDCLVKSKEDCALDNDTAYTFKDCDGQFGEAQSNFLAGAGTQLLQSNNIDELATAGMSLSTSITPDEYGAVNPY